MKKKAIIVDIDGTISENVTNRPWFGSPERMLEDKPYENIINLISAYSYVYKLDVLILTGRHQGKELDVTKEWLKKNSFLYDEIFARDLKDFSKTAIYKEKVYEEKIKPCYDIIMVFEDNNSCVQMFRNKGLTVLQPQNSDY